MWQSLTRFEDRHRLPIGVSVNFTSHAAKLLTQVGCRLHLCSVMVCADRNAALLLHGNEQAWHPCPGLSHSLAGQLRKEMLDHLQHRWHTTHGPSWCIPTLVMPTWRCATALSWQSKGRS